MTHGTGHAGRTANSRVLESWAEIGRKVHRLDIKFDKAYTDSDYPREGIPIEGITIPADRNVNLDNLDPQWTILYSLALKNPQLRWVPCESHNLMEEYRAIMAEQQERELTGDLQENHRGKYSDIIYKRDLHIAQRIKEDLKIGEVGVLFLGSSHNKGENTLAELLEEDGIEVTIIETSPPLPGLDEA
jgi:hypothetical protein